MAKHIFTYINPPSERDLDAACLVLEQGGVIAYPTDVNWSIGCDASNVKAVDRLRAIKPAKNIEVDKQPFSLIFSSLSMAANYATVDGHHYRLLKKSLPGPYTFILKRSKNLARQINDKRRIVGIRIPQSPLILALVDKFARPLATTSLSFPLDSEMNYLKFGFEIEERFGHGIDLILDLGEEVIYRETSIIDLSSDEPQIVRSGVGDISMFQLIQNES
ncbi:MAG: L-threonylcarbamoyladenylate synthase [Bdellovibrionota bacterium]